MCVGTLLTLGSWAHSCNLALQYPPQIPSFLNRVQTLRPSLPPTPSGPSPLMPRAAPWSSLGLGFGSGWRMKLASRPMAFIHSMKATEGFICLYQLILQESQENFSLLVDYFWLLLAHWLPPPHCRRRRRAWLLLTQQLWPVHSRGRVQNCADSRCEGSQPTSFPKCPPRATRWLENSTRHKKIPNLK